jgi:hypothetical protein
VNSYKDFKKKKENKYHKVVLISSPQCHFCVDFTNKVWNVLSPQMHASKTTQFLKIDSSLLGDIKENDKVFYDRIITNMLSYSSGIPNIAKYNVNTKRLYPFDRSNARTVENFNKFIAKYL